MSKDSIDAFRAELADAMLATGQQRSALRALVNLPLSDETLAGIDQEIAAVTDRMALIQSAVDALKNLSDDGYPEMPTTPVSGAVRQELADEKSAIQQALDVLMQGKPEPQASHIHVSLGEAKTKP